MLRSVASIEAQYLTRVTSKINETVSQAFAGGGRTPNSIEGANLARAVANELDAARFDPLLVRSVAQSAATCLNGILGRADYLVGLYSLSIVLTDVVHFRSQWIVRRLRWWDQQRPRRN